MPHELLDHAWQGMTTMAVGFGSIILTIIVLSFGLRHEQKHQAKNQDEH